MKLSVVKIEEKKEGDLRWPVERLLSEIEDYDEILIIGRKKSGESYKRYSTAMKSTFWWLGALEALKYELIEESCVVTEEK